MSQKGQKLTIYLLATRKDCFGVIEVDVSINGKQYTYPITSEFILRKVQKMIRLKKFGKALHLLSLFQINGFNYFKEVEDVHRTRVKSDEAVRNLNSRLTNFQGDKNKNEMQVVPNSHNTVYSAKKD